MTRSDFSRRYVTRLESRRFDSCVYRMRVAIFGIFFSDTFVLGWRKAFAAKGARTRACRLPAVIAGLRLNCKVHLHYFKIL